MNKRLISLFMAVVICMSFVAVGAVTVSAESESELKTSQACVDLIKEQEGFRKYPYWDYGQYTVGYGTRCPAEMVDYYLANGISEAEAEALLYNYLNMFEEAVQTMLIDKYNLTFTQGQFDALVSFSYNCGTGWLYKQQDNLKDAIIGGVEENVLIDRFSRWCNAGGQLLLPLLRRRLSEANMFINGEYSKTPPENFAYVLYDATGGEVDYNVQGYNIETPVELYITPTYEGYEFQGWYTERIGGTKVEILDASTKNMRLYAHWLNAEGKVPGEEDVTDGTKVTIRVDELNIRKGPGTNYEAVGKLNTGDVVYLTETAANGSYTWGKFYGGWIRLDYTDYEAPEEEEKVPEASAAVTGTVNVNDYLRIRSGPSTGYSVVGNLSKGDRVVILEQKIVGYMVWGRIEQGWISMDYVILDKEEEAPQQPETSEPEATDPTEPEATEPEATEPTVPEATEPTEPEVTEPEATEPTVPEATEPAAPVVTVPEETVPPVTEPEEEQQPAGQAGTIKVNDFLRIRTGAGTSYAIAGYLSPNQKVTILEIKQVGSITWGRIDQGWISMDYVVLDKESESEQAPAPEQKPENGGSTEEKPAAITGTVNVKDFLRVRSSPSTSATIVSYLASNDRVEILEKKTVSGTVWGRIEQGWISMDYVVLDQQSAAPEQSEPQKPQTVTKTVVVNDCLRVRGGAGTGYAVVGYLYNGAKVEILETKVVNGITWGRMAKGWISMDYVV